jgi:hypothetical protein
VSTARAAQRVERCPGAASLAEVAYQRPDIKPGGAGERDSAAVVAVLDELDTQYPHAHGLERNRFIPSRQLIGSPSRNLLRRVGGRHLHLLAFKRAEGRHECVA